MSGKPENVTKKKKKKIHNRYLCDELAPTNVQMFKIKVNIWFKYLIKADGEAGLGDISDKLCILWYKHRI